MAKLKKVIKRASKSAMTEKTPAIKLVKKDHSGARHSVWSASGSERWVNCAGSINAVEALPEVIKNQPQSIFAAEGTAAHHLADLCLKSGEDAEAYAGKAIAVNRYGDCEIIPEMPDEEIPEDSELQTSYHEINDEMVEGVQLYLDTIRKDLAETPNGQLSSEARADLSWLHPGMFGTRDARISQPFGLLRIYDLKYGKGVPVTVLNNSQEKYYSLEDVKFGDFETVELVVVQPRLILEGDDPPGVRRWTTTPDELLEWAYDILLPAVEASKDPDAPRTAGEWCFWCLAGPFCKEKLEYIQEQASIDFDDDIDVETGMATRKRLESDIDILRKSYKALTLMDNHAKMVNLVVDLLLRSGEQLDFAKLVNKRSRRVFIEDNADRLIPEIIARAKEAGVRLKKSDLYSKPKPLSPRQVELLNPKKLKPVVAELAEPRSSGLTVADIDDPREAVEWNPGDDFTDDPEE